MDAVDLHPLSLPAIEAPLGIDADAWFLALDGRAVCVGEDTGIIRVEGIHRVGATLWIQVALFDDDRPGLVLQVHAAHTSQDVFDTLSGYALTGVPLEIVRIAPVPLH